MLDLKLSLDFHSGSSYFAHQSRISVRYFSMIAALAGCGASLVSDATNCLASLEASSRSPRASLAWAASENQESASSCFAASGKLPLLLIHGAPYCCQASANTTAKSFAFDEGTTVHQKSR